MGELTVTSVVTPSDILPLLRARDAADSALRAALSHRDALVLARHEAVRASEAQGAELSVRTQVRDTAVALAAEGAVAASAAAAALKAAQAAADAAAAASQAAHAAVGEVARTEAEVTNAQKWMGSVAPPPNASADLLERLKTRDSADSAWAAALSQRNALASSVSAAQLSAEQLAADVLARSQARDSAAAVANAAAAAVEVAIVALANACTAVDNATAVSAASAAAVAAASATAGVEGDTLPLKPLGLNYLRAADTTCGFLHRSNPLRRVALLLVRFPHFDTFILLNILLNFILLAGVRPLLEPSDDPFLAATTKLEPWFQFLFAFEAALKLIAIGPRAYFDDAWCVFDFLIVGLCYLVYIPGTGNASALRALRALRPLRSFGLIPSLRRIFNGIAAVAANTVRIEILEWFSLFAVALVGVQLWAGALLGGCFYAAAPNVTEAVLSAAALSDADPTAIVSTTAWTAIDGFVRNRAINDVLSNAVDAFGYCALPLASATTGYFTAAAPSPYACPAVYDFVGNDTSKVSLVTQSCFPYENPLSYGAPTLGFSFDNVGIAFLTVLVSETEEGWSIPLTALWHTWGGVWFVFAYFVGIVFFLDMFMGTFLEATMWAAFVTANEIEDAKVAHDAKPETVREIIALERVALYETLGSWAPTDAHEKAARSSAAFTAGLESIPVALDAFYTRWVPGIPEVISRAIRPLEASYAFNIISQVVVCANIILLAWDYRDAPEAYNLGIKYANWAFVAFFVMELCIRLLALGTRKFVSDFSNVFDVAIVVGSVADVLSNELLSVSAGGISAIRVLRLFRIIRTLKLARSWRQLNVMLTTLGRSIAPTLSFLFVVFVFILVFACIGLQIFGGRYKEAIAAGHIDEYPRANFDTFGWAIVSTYNVIDGENWFIPLYQHMAIIGPVAALFFVCVEFVGGIIFSLMLATFMMTFEEDEEREEEEKLAALIGGDEREAPFKVDVDPRLLGGEAIKGGAPIPSTPSKVFHFEEGSSRVRALAINLPQRSTAPPASLIDAGAHPLTLTGRPVALRIAVTSDNARVVGVDTETGRVLEAHRLEHPAAAFDAHMLPPGDFRRPLASLIYSDAFDAFSFLVTLWACVNLALDAPWLNTCGTSVAVAACATTAPPLVAYVNAADAAVTAFFFAEIVAKCICQGLWASPFGFLRSRWNLIDLVVAVTSVASLAIGQQVWSAGFALRAIRVARTLRALRGLRFFRTTLLAPVLDTIVAMLPAAANAAVLTFFFVYIFAIIGMQSFMGIANSCNDFNIDSAKDCVGTFTLVGRNCAFLPTLAAETACKAMGPFSNVTFPRRFEATNPNWDTFSAALLQVYMLTDGENWQSLMYTAVDGGDEVGDSLSRDHNQGRAVYFIVLTLVMGAVIMDLLVGVVRSTYTELRDHAGGRMFLTHGERKLLANSMLVLESAPIVRVPRPPSVHAFGGWAAVAHAIVHTSSFEVMTFVLITASTIAVAVHHAPADGATASRLDGVYYTFAGLFAAEVSVRLIAGGLDPWARAGWNAYDSCCTLTALVGVGISMAASAGLLSSDFAVLRVALALRAFRLVAAIPALRHRVPYLDGLQPVLRAMRRAFPRFLLLLLFFATFIFVYAIIGMAAFGNVRHGYAGDNQGGNAVRSTGNLNADANFETLPTAFWTLLRTYTGENWNYLLVDLMVQPPYCIDASDGTNTCGSPVFAPLFYVPYMLFGVFVFNSLLIGMLLDVFWLDAAAQHHFVQWADPVGRRLYNFTHAAGTAFADAWSHFDAHGDLPGVSIETLTAIVGMVDEPLGARAFPPRPTETIAEGKARAQALVESLDLGGERKAIPYTVALHALVEHAGEAYGTTTFGAVVLGRGRPSAPSGVDGAASAAVDVPSKDAVSSQIYRSL